MDPGAADMDAVVAEDTVDQGVAALEADVVEFQSRHVSREQGSAHLDGGSVGFGIDGSGVGHAHHQIEVAHRLAEDARRHLGQRHRLPLSAPREAHSLDRRPLDLRGAPP